MNEKNYILQNARYHRFILKDGTEVMPSDGHDFYPMLDVIFDSDMSGKSLLDIGCSNGFYTIEAAKLGARCSGLEQSPAFLKTALLLAADAEVDVDFIRGHWPLFGEQLIDNKFDITLLMNVIHHNDSKGIADYQLAEAVRITSEKLILCIANEEDKPNKIYYSNSEIEERVSPKFLVTKKVPYLEAGGNCDGRTILICERDKE